MEADLTREKKVNIEETPESAEHTDAHGQPVPDAHGHEHTHEHEHAREHRHIHEQEQAHEHKHTHEYMHVHGIPHSHGPGHVHSPEEKKRRLNRISRIIGHLEHVRRMIEEDYENENCIEESAWAVDMFYGMDDYDGYSFTEPYEK